MSSGTTSPSTPGTTGTSTPFTCSPAGIAAYADMLVDAARKSCTSDGVGVVDQRNYTCMQAPIESLAVPHKDVSFNVVKTLLADNTAFPKFECTYFVQTVTAGVCGTPISPNDKAWTDYPLAAEFAGKTVSGYTWIPNNRQQDVQPGDIFVYGVPSGGDSDPNHIMIVAAVIDRNHFRVAEANELKSDGSSGLPNETGVVSNTRIATLDEEGFTGWFRLDAQ